MDSLKFTKMNGAGNDFIVLDAIKYPGIGLNETKIQQLCDRRKGIGADGILLIGKSKQNDFDLKYYNSDGSLGSLCANGSRCALKYFFDRKISDHSKINFSCKNEVYTGEVLSENSVKFNLKPPSKMNFDLKIKYNNNLLPVYYIDTGSPHAVFLWRDINDLFSSSFHKFNFVKFGKEMRYNENFGIEGTNVNVINESDGKFYIRTYERGVEAETYSCGTGTVASALVLNAVNKIPSPISFITFGNDKLVVDFRLKNDTIQKISLTGPVKINYIGSCNF